jgi:flavin-dependent dehydrogenase
MSAEIVADAVVVGGGPAGSTAATVLAQRGYDVVLLERARFPRYKVGESLLPYSWWTLDRIGALDKVEAAGFQAKYSVRFVTPAGKLSKPFLFSDHLEHASARTWQVKRSVFDQLLLDNATDKGVRVLQDTRASKLIDADGTAAGVVAEGPDGPVTIRAKVTVDASGRDGFVRGLRRWRKPEAALDRVALWSYFRGIPREDGVNEGATTVVAFEGDGWAWFIPMQDDIVSVGVVRRREDLFATSKKPDEAFTAQLAHNPWLAERVAQGEQVGPVKVTSDYSYRSEYCADDGVVLCGDAFAFLDPVFSSGVFLALATGERAGNAAADALASGDVSAAAFADYGDWVCEGIEAMRALVFSFYDPSFSMGKMVRKHPELIGDVTDLLIGNLFRDFDALYSALGEFGALPQRLEHGRTRQRVGEVA